MDILRVSAITPITGVHITPKKTQKQQQDKNKKGKEFSKTLSSVKVRTV